MRWLAHVAKLSVYQRLPGAEALRQIKRKIVGYAPDPSNIASTLRNWQYMREELESTGFDIRDKTFLEIGTGWFPTIPIKLLTLGAAKVVLTDLNPHLDDVTFRATLKHLEKLGESTPAFSDINFLRQLPFVYLAPFDPATIPDASIDCVVSRTVLEHIPRQTIIELFSKLRPKLRSGGLMVHHVDHSDHLEHFDRSLSKVEFLTWSSRKHDFINWLTGEGENRLRHHEYFPVFESAGYEVIKSHHTVHQPTLKRVATMKLSSPYREMTAEQVSILDSTYVLRSK